MRGTRDQKSVQQEQAHSPDLRAGDGGSRSSGDVQQANPAPAGRVDAADVQKPDHRPA